jgi:hypothetical protein
MQMMPKISWPHRVESDAVARPSAVPDVLVISIPMMSLSPHGFSALAYLIPRQV